MNDSRYFYGKGRRKTAVAKVRLYENGSGNCTVNGKPVKEYFPLDMLVDNVFSPLKNTSMLKKFDISVITKGGGIHGQSDAVKLGVARALVVYDENLRVTLRSENHLTRDPRKKERKKPGLKRARRAPQFSKR